MNAQVVRGALLVVGVLAGYWIVLAANPARASLRDGARCLRRYPRVWLIPTAFALAHAGFHLWVRVYESWAVPGAGPIIDRWTAWQPPAWADVLSSAVWPAGESGAAIFNCIVTTFPLSAAWAAMFLVNWRGAQAGLARAFRRRFGWAGGTAIHLGLVVCAAASLCKPFFFGGLPQINLYLGAAALEQTGEVINWLSFLYEYLLGVCIQIYVVLLCYAWIRGLTFDFDSLRRFALRRFAFVVKWALVVMIVSSVGIHLPLVVASFQTPEQRGSLEGLGLHTRQGLALALPLFCAMQSLLVFHNESLGHAFADQLRLWRRHVWHLSWFLVIVALHFLALEAANVFFPLAFGPWTWPAALWTLGLHPLLWSGLVSWFLVSWVCLFLRCERNRPDAEELVNY